jgi:hypothetical protein
MENKIIGRQLVEFHKATFDNTFNSLVTLQEQAEKMVGAFLEEAGWLPAEGKEAIQGWVNIYKKGRIDFKAAADKNYSKVEEFFSTDQPASKVKTSKAK